MKNFGGNWTEQKLEAFISYVKAYLIILNSAKKKYAWQTIYFDGFAGYGKRDKTVGNDEFELFEKIFSDDSPEAKVYEGSVARILSLEDPFLFDWYYFIDSNKSYIQNLESIKKDISHIRKDRIIIRHDNCNDQVIKLAKALQDNKSLAALIFLDPFGMQIDWNSIQKLKGTKSDVWILIPSGVAVNRLLDRKKELRCKKKLEAFFGLSIEEIEDVFYTSTEHETLFGQRETTQKIIDPINKIIEIYTKQLNKIWKHVTNPPLELRNRVNNPIFHFIFASNNSSGFKIASQIVAKGQKK